MHSDKIVFLIRSLNHGGAERQLVALAKGLWAQGLQVSVAVFYSGGRLEQDLREAGVPVIALEKKGRWDIFPFVWRLFRMLRENRINILHSYLVDPNILVIPLKLLLPRLKIVWGVRASDMDLNHYDWSSRLAFRLSCRLSRFADLIIVNSYAGRAYHMAHNYPKDKMVVIPNGIDSSRFVPDKAAGKRVRAEWGIGDREVLIGVVSRLDPVKDHSTFLKAAAIVSRERKGIRFLCVGDGPEAYRAKLQTTCRDLGFTQHVLWVGNRADIEAVYNALDILVSSSSSEGFPNVIAEAMACGIPCVVTDAGDSAYIVGNLGKVVPVRREDLMAREVLECLVDRRSLTPALLRQSIVDRFSINKLEKDTIAVFQRLRENRAFTS